VVSNAKQSHWQQALFLRLHNLLQLSCPSCAFLIKAWPCTDAVCSPADPGYTLISEKNWAGTSETSEGHTGPEEAKKICASTFNCLAWNNYGYYIQKKAAPFSLDLKYFDYGGLCIYKKHPGKYP
jgi:hypothetical protein